MAAERIGDGRVRLRLKRPFSDATFAIEMDELSLCARLAALVPPPWQNQVRYCGVLAPASKFWPRFIDGHCRANKHKPSGMSGKHSCFRNHLGPMFAKKRLDQFTQEDIARLKRRLVDHTSARLPHHGKRNSRSSLRRVSTHEPCAPSGPRALFRVRAQC